MRRQDKLLEKLSKLETLEEFAEFAEKMKRKADISLIRMYIVLGISCSYLALVVYFKFYG